MVKMQQFEANPELFPSMSNEDYHGDRTAVSSTALKKILISPAHYQAHLAQKHEPTPALEFGTALHEAVLEPAEFAKHYTVAPVVDRRTKAGKEAWEQFIATNAGKRFLTQDEMEQIQKIVQSVSRHRMASLLIQKGKAEQSIFWTDPATGIRCKVRPDSLSSYAILDLKSAASAHRNDFPRACVKYGYDMSAAMYQEGVRQLTGETLDFGFLAAEKDEPFAVALYKASEEMLASGYKKFRTALETLRECMDKNPWGRWDAYQPDGDFELLEWPRWARVSEAEACAD